MKHRGWQRVVGLAVFCGIGCGGEASPPDTPTDAGSTPTDTGNVTADTPEVAPARHAAIATSCWAPSGFACDPNTGSGCAEGETCDVVAAGGGETLEIVCVPAPTRVRAGASCDAARGLQCAPGLRCVAGRCADGCCDDTDCGRNAACTALATAHGTLGHCRALCGGNGAHCTRAADCCSGDCHGDHCH